MIRFQCHVATGAMSLLKPILYMIELLHSLMDFSSLLCILN